MGHPSSWELQQVDRGWGVKTLYYESNQDTGQKLIDK